MNKRKFRVFTTTLSAFIMSALFVLTAYANLIDPMNPGDSSATAWAFNNAMEVTQQFQVGRAHQYRLNATGPDYAFRLTFTSPVGNPSEVRILDANETIIRTIETTGGQHQQDIILSSGHFYIQIINTSNLNNQPYTLIMRPDTTILGFRRTPGGHAVQIIDGDLYVNGARVPNPNVNHMSAPIFISEVESFHAGFDVGRLFFRNTNIMLTDNAVDLSATIVHRSAQWGSIEAREQVVLIYDASNRRWYDTYDLYVSNNWVTFRRYDAVQPSAPASQALPPQNLSIDFANETLTGANAMMQFSLNGGTTWTNFNAINPIISSHIPAFGRPDAVMQVRFRETGMFLASEVTEIILPARQIPAPATSEVNFNGFTETISVNDTMEFRIGTSGEWNQVAPGQTSIPATIGTSSTTHQVRVRSTSDQFASAIRSVSVSARQAAPNATYQASTDRINGVSNAMEFSLDNGTTWTRLTANTIPRETLGNNAITVQVRRAATATEPISLVRVVEVPDGPAAAPAGFEIDFAREVLTGVAPGMQWSTNGTTWTNISTNEIDIASIIPTAASTADTTLMVRIASTATVPASRAAEMILTPRFATPTTAAVRFDGFTETISINDTMEYRVGTSGEWNQVAPGQASISVTIGTANVTHQIRVRNTNDRFASEIRSISVPRRPNAPSATYNPASDAITGLTATREFSLDNGTTWTRVVGTTITRNVLGNDAITVQIRIAATATAPFSLVSIVEVPNGPADAPSGLEIDFAREILTGVAPGMQWSTNGTNWTNITTNELNITDRIPSATAVANTNLRIRIASTSIAPPSIPTEIILTPRPATPASSVVRFDGFTETISVDDTMEYRIGASGEWIQVALGKPV